MAAQEELFIGHFSKHTPGQDVPDGWEPLLFKSIDHHTRYTLVDDSGKTVVAAVCKGGSSGLIRPVRIDPEKYPIIEWRWKVANTFAKGDVTQKSGDDYPARLYITFEFELEKGGLMNRVKHKILKRFYGQSSPGEAINYIWASKAPEGTVVPSPYTKQSMMIVVQSGNADLNRWVVERRNIYTDYTEAFGKKPTMISGIAIMTDSNDTGESVKAYYGDIILKSGP